MYFLLLDYPPDVYVFWGIIQYNLIQYNTDLRFNALFTVNTRSSRNQLWLKEAIAPTVSKDY